MMASTYRGPQVTLNYLAHVHLAPADPLPRIGNLLGDFVRGIDVATLPTGVQTGIAQHRQIDRFTDAHPVFRRSRGRLSQRFARLSGVLVDVFYDHFLARDWQRWGDGRALPLFTADVYRLLHEHRAWLPSRLCMALPHMQAHDWLVSVRRPRPRPMDSAREDAIVSACEGTTLVLGRRAGRNWLTGMGRCWWRRPVAA